MGGNKKGMGAKEGAYSHQLEVFRIGILREKLESAGVKTILMFLHDFMRYKSENCERHKK